MSVITFPTSLTASKVIWGQQRRDAAYTSIFGSQGVEVAAPLWSVSLTSPQMSDVNSGEWKAMLMNLRGKVNQLSLWDLGRPVPNGTMRGTMTLNVIGYQGSVALDIVASGQAGTTLLAGDLLGVGSGVTQQVVMVTANATANGSSVISVSIEPPLRNQFAAGAVVTWSKPSALFRSIGSKSQWEYGVGREIGSMTLELLEDWRP